MEHGTSHRDSQRTKLSVELELFLHPFATRLKRKFADQVARDAASFKKLVVRLIRRELPPRPGHPTVPRLDAAYHLFKRGMTVRRILRRQVPGFKGLDTYGQMLAEQGLRKAFARRRKRENDMKKSTQ
jgi:hypothetical protein